MKIELVYYRSGESKVEPRRSALVAEGRRWLSVMMMEGGALTVRQVPRSERRFMEPVLDHGKPYSIRKAAHHYRTYGQRHGTTKKAQAFLKIIKAQERNRRETETS